MIIGPSYEIVWQRDGGEHTLLTTTSVDGRELVVAATADHTIGLWDAADGASAGSGYSGHSHVFGLAATVLAGLPVVASVGLNSVPLDIVEEFFDGDEDASEVGVISIWDPATSDELGSPITDDGEMDAADVLDLTAITDGGSSFLLGIIGNEAAVGCVVTWSLKTRAQERFFPDGLVHPTYVDAMATVLVDGQQAVIAAVTHDHFDDQSGGTYQVCAWNGHTGAPIGQPWEVTAVERDAVLAVTVVSGQPMAALFTPRDDHIRLHQLPHGEPAGALRIADVGSPSLLHTGYRGGSAILAAAHADGVVTVWDLAKRERMSTITDIATVNALLLPAGGLLVAATDNGLVAIRI